MPIGNKFEPRGHDLLVTCSLASLRSQHQHPDLLRVLLTQSGVLRSCFVEKRGIMDVLHKHVNTREVPSVRAACCKNISRITPVRVQLQALGLCSELIVARPLHQ